MVIVSYSDIRSDMPAKSLGMLGRQMNGGENVTMSGIQTVGCERHFMKISFVFSFLRECAQYSIHFLSYSKVALMETNYKVGNYLTKKTMKNISGNDSYFLPLFKCISL
jgi:hypothetical protein